MCILRGSTVELAVTLTQLEFRGQVRGRSDRKLVFAWGGLPGEEVIVRITKRQRRSYSGVVVDVLSPSPDRVDPAEEHFLSCSPWQVMDPEREPTYKQQLVRELFAREFPAELPPFDVVGNVDYEYRNKLEFSFTESDDGLSLAFYERGSFRHKVPVRGCRLGVPAINHAAAHICRALRDAHVPASSLKSLMLRADRAGRVVAGLYATERIPRVAGAVAASEQVSGFRVFLSDPRSPAAVAGECLESYGTMDLVDTVRGRQLRYCDRSFFQINVPVLERAVEDICSYVEGDRPLWDLYAGVGTLGVCAGVPRTVFVESHPETASYLEQNCRQNGIDDPEIITEPVEKAIEAIPEEATVIMDPPRAGIHPRLIRRLSTSQPARLIYLSCNPETQVRDLVALNERYELVHFSAYNFFPRTPRLETLAILDRRAS